MALGTSGGIHLTPSYELAMNPGLEFLLDRAVTLSASPGDVEKVDRGGRITGRQYPVGGSTGRVAIVAGGCSILAASSGLAVNTFLIHFDGMLELDVQLGKKVLILVTIAAGSGQIGGMNHGARIIWGQDPMNPVAILASRNRRGLAYCSPAVNGVGFFDILMAGSAIGVRQIRGMWKLKDPSVTIGTDLVLVDTADQMRVAHYRGLSTRIGVAIRANRIGVIFGRYQGRQKYQTQS